MTDEDKVEKPEELVKLAVKLVLCRILEAEYLEPNPEDIHDINASEHRVRIVCEEIESGIIGGGILSAEDISAIAGVEKVMEPRQLIDFVTRLNHYDTEFLMPIPDNGMILVDAELEVDDTEEKIEVVNYPIFPPLTEKELQENNSIGTTFAKKRKK